MLLYAFLAVLVLALLALVARFQPKRASGTGGAEIGTLGDDDKDAGDTYALRSALLTPAERSFLGALVQVIPADMAIFAKVRLGDVFAPRLGLDPSARATAHNQINRKHVDFLIVRSSDLTFVAGIELDDRSHRRPDRQARDAFVDGVFAACELPLFHIPAQSGYRVTELRAELDPILGGQTKRLE